MKQRILDVARNAWCSCAVDAAGLLIDADDYYRSFYRAAERAQSSILLCGWQFDSDVELLRGPEAEAATLPVTLKAFLNALCERSPTLEIRVLAWDYHVVFALEREWMQRLALHWTTHSRCRFRFDDNHAPRGCHHQKFVVIDGALSFVGGIDLCQHRWDVRAHREHEPLRISRGEEHKPFHDVQSYLVGTASAERLTNLFQARWQRSGGDPFQLAAPPAYRPEDWAPARGTALPATQVTLSRTDPAGSPTGVENCCEVLALQRDAIAAAQRSIYAETQYFSSHEVAAALIARLRAGGPALDVVLITNMEAETLKEQVAVGLAQAKILGELRAAAVGTEHRVGLYYTVPDAPDGREPERATYIHSKLMIIDDQLLVVGSANLTNRSCSVDTELNASFEAAAGGDAELARAIRAVRLDLLSEHMGLPVTQGDVATLDAHARTRRGRLRIHPSPTVSERAVLSVVDPQQLPFDPSEPEMHDPSLFTRAIDIARRIVD